MKRSYSYVGSLVLALGTLLCAGQASAAAEGAARLGRELTPAGGEKSGNKDGSIPAWTGTEPPQAGWSYGKKRADFWKHKGEKPLFSIDASNVDKYADKLSPGQVATIKQVKGFRMDVYPSHRTCGAPDFVESNTKRNVGIAKVGDDGWTLAEAVVPGYPFPIPANGTEAMWNSKMRYRGIGIEWRSLTTVVSPRKGGSEWIKAGVEQTYYFPWGDAASATLSSLPQVEYFVYFAYTSPAALAGQAMALSFFLNRPGSETFYYFPGQRRVRRMPTYSYDSPMIGFENQYAVDEPSVFNGTIDRFDWKLVGKKEIYVPYNTFGAHDFTSKIEDVALADAPAASHRRYELHRVWVVEGTVKPGTRHSSPKKVMYLDEDSWNALLSDDYDAQGKLWKAREGYLIPVYETGSCDAVAATQYNLTEGRYVIDMHGIGGKDVEWLTKPRGPRYKPSFYTSDNLRAISDR